MGVQNYSQNNSFHDNNNKLINGQSLNRGTTIFNHPAPPPPLASKKQIELKPQPQKIGLCELFSKT